MVNISGILNAFRLLMRPSLCLPHATVSTFDQIPLPVSRLLKQTEGSKQPDIRALVLDKDNCFALAKENQVYAPYKSHFEALRISVSTDGATIIVSNSAGSTSDTDAAEAKVLQSATQVQVLRHRIKKPGCWKEVFESLRDKPGLEIQHPRQIAVIGDRLLTDVMMANLMGCWAIWVKDGVVVNQGIFARMERRLPRLLVSMGVRPPIPG